MNCLHPHTKTICDPLTGERRVITYPCGKCLLCLQAFQKSWQIRISESLDNQPYFIFDTLTFRNDTLPLKDVTEEWNDPDRIISPASMRFQRFYTFRNDGRIYVPVCDKSCISAWIKRGRELYYKHTKKRLHIKYFICMEYGPRTSRPHAHLMIWGISLYHYRRFFAKQWQKWYGFTATKFVDNRDRSLEGSKRAAKNNNCVARYISKYVSKGVFESPFVRDGFAPKPPRCISHGIGVEYLDRMPFVSEFSGVMPDYWKSLAVDTRYPAGDLRRNMHVKHLLLTTDISEGFKAPSAGALVYLNLYVNKQGFRFALPRYYRQKLLKSHIPNVYSYKIQKILLALRNIADNKRLRNFCSQSLGFVRFVKRIRPECEYAGLSPRLYNQLSSLLHLQELREAKAKADEVYISLKNHYKRALSLPVGSLSWRYAT